MRKILVSVILAFTCSAASLAGGLPDGLGLKVRAGYSVGGTAPLEMPAAIRSFDDYRLTPSVMVGAEVSYAFTERWGLLGGLRFENKGMDAAITVKGYRMEMIKSENRIEGLFYGHVRQEVAEWVLTVPVQASYRLGKVLLKAGPYVSFLVSGEFSGVASDGYLRQGDPTGPKILIGTGDDSATYDFSDRMSPVQAGVGVGADWTIAAGFGVSADLEWGLTGLFKRDFKTIEQTLYPIYGTLGLFYQF